MIHRAGWLTSKTTRRRQRACLRLQITYMNGTEREGMRGRWLVLGILGVAVLLGLIALRFRKLTPRPAPPTTTATTQSGV